MYQGSVCDWQKQILNQSEALPMTWVMTRRQNGILRSFLRRHLAGKTAVASRNVDCFLKLSSPEIAYLFDLKTFANK